MTTLMTETATTTFTVQPFAIVPIDGDPGDLLDRVLDALELDPLALGAVCGYEQDTGRVDAIFQVELPDVYGASAGGIERASGEAAAIFDRALRRARIVDAHTAGVSVVHGDDPDLLP